MKLNPVKVVAPKIYVVGGTDLTHIYDSNSYLIDIDNKFILIDSGSGFGFINMINNILELGIKPHEISYVVLTHCHLSNAGGSKYFREIYKIPTIAHEIEARKLMNSESECIDIQDIKTYDPIPISLIIKEEERVLHEISKSIKIIHTPGHTPGALSVIVKLKGVKVGIVGDLLGPLSKKWNSNENEWRGSIKRIISENLDVLCTSGDCVVGKLNVKSLLEKAISLKPLWI